MSDLKFVSSIDYSVPKNLQVATRSVCELRICSHIFI